MERPKHRMRVTWGKGILLAGLALAVLGGYLVYVWAYPSVKWSSVMQSMGKQKTLHGKGHVYLRDGSEWEYALWAKVDGPGKTVPNARIRAVRLPGAQKGLPPQPDPVLRKLGAAMDVCGEDGIITGLAGSRHGSARGRRTEWNGKPAIIVELRTPADLARGRGQYPDSWRFYIDPRSRLVLAASMLVREGGEEVVRARCEYQYNEPLPPGFRER